MSYSNYRNYQLAVAERQRAMAAQQQAQNIRNQATARANRMSQEWQGSHGDPRASVGNMNNMLSRENSSHYAEMSNRQLESQQAYANALNDEITQMQDRMADMSENVIGGKRASDEMKYNLEMTKARNDHQARMAENNARIAMNSKTNDSLAASMDGFNQSLAGGKPEMPSVELYDNDGEYVGGSQYAGKNLFDKTGIKKSLMS
jgi:hypothetical protein